ncbi:hypothetical protein D9M71_450000 [compost metagenome]
MVGNTPNSAVEIPTPTIDTISARLRPCLSAYAPKIAEPSGRTSKATANEAYTAASDSVGVSEGKNRRPMIGAT